MADKKEKTCRKCGHKYTGRHCMNRNCQNYHQGKAKARAAARRRSAGKMRFGRLSSAIMPASSPVSGQGSQISVNPSAVQAPVETPHDEAIARANNDFDYFLELVAEGDAALMSMRDEQDYFRMGA